jgi:C_GCAxxG_C_C family probable redox protein
MEKDELIQLIRTKAEALYTTKQMLCSDAVLSAINSSLGPWLTKEQAIAIMAAFPIGIGNGCLCGAISGGLAVLGLALSDTHSPKEIRAYASDIYLEFNKKYKSTCCSVLTKKIKDNKQNHFQQCALITGDAAEITANIILSVRPELIESTDMKYLLKKETHLKVFFNKIKSYFKKREKK